jgi:Domain of unknown function (DUF6285)
MQDQPGAAALVAAVAEFLRGRALPQLDAHAAYHARVAANALDIVARELTLGPAAAEVEMVRLQALLGRDGALDELNQALAEAIENGTLDTATPALAEHLWTTTLDKLAIDQPSYAGYRRALEK